MFAWQTVGQLRLVLKNKSWEGRFLGLPKAIPELLLGNRTKLGAPLVRDSQKLIQCIIIGISRSKGQATSRCFEWAACEGPNTWGVQGRVLFAKVGYSVPPIKNRSCSEKRYINKDTFVFWPFRPVPVKSEWQMYWLTDWLTVCMRAQSPRQSKRPGVLIRSMTET